MLRHPRAVALAISNRRVIWLRLCGAIAIAGLIFASLLLPAEWERLRTGHWWTEHFLAYFVASLVICLGWPRPFVVAGALAVAAAILETLQGLTPNHSASVDLVMAGAAGALTAALIAKLTMVAWSRRARWRLAFRRRAEGVSDDVGKARTKHSERIAMASPPRVLEAFANHRSNLVSALWRPRHGRHRLCFAHATPHVGADAHGALVRRALFRVFCGLVDHLARLAEATRGGLRPCHNRSDIGGAARFVTKSLGFGYLGHRRRNRGIDRGYIGQTDSGRISPAPSRIMSSATAAVGPIRSLAPCGWGLVVLAELQGRAHGAFRGVVELKIPDRR